MRRGGFAAREPPRPWWSWRFAAELVLLAVLAQACGGSSQSSGPSGNRVELRFNEVKRVQVGLLPSGCQKVDITIQPDGKTVTASDTSVSLLLPAGPHSASAVLFCGAQSFFSDKPDPQFVVPPSLNSVEVTLVFGGVNVILTVQVGAGVKVTGPDISCPGDCTQEFIAGANAALSATPPNAVFSGDCTGVGSCNVLMNTSKTVVVGLPAPGASLTLQVGAGVRVTGPGISCPGDCTQEFPVGANAGLTASPPNAVFSGDCTGVGSCNILMNASKTVVVALPPAVVLTVQVEPGVRVTGSGISCPAIAPRSSRSAPTPA